MWLALLRLSGCDLADHTLVTPPIGCEEVASARIVATGDVMLHGGVLAAARNHGGWDVVFGEIAPGIGAADLAFVNLEFPIAPLRGRATGPLVFNGDPVILDSLATVGFDVASFANNHVYDQGRDGLVESLEHLDRSGLVYVGAGRSCPEARRARILDVTGISVALIGSTQAYNQDLNPTGDEACVATFDIDHVLAEVARVRALGAELVVLSVHWGAEYSTLPRVDQHDTAHQLIEGGVDVILGHHPHVLQPIETLVASDGRRGVVAYSLGNLVSNQAARYVAGRDPIDEGNPRDGVLLEIDVVRRRYGATLRTEIARVEPVSLWTTSDDRVALSDERRAHVRGILYTDLHGASPPELPPSDPSVGSGN